MGIKSRISTTQSESFQKKTLMLLKYKPRKQNLKRVPNNEVKKLGKIYLLEKGNVKTVSAHFAEKKCRVFQSNIARIHLPMSTLKCPQNSDLPTDSSS